MKLVLLPAALLPLSIGPSEGVTLTFAPEEGAKLKRVFTAEAEYHLADLTASIDGEPLERGELPDYTTGFSEHIAVTDSLERLSEGRPIEFVRTFEELRQDSREGLDGEEASEELSSPLEGRSVRFTAERGEQDYQVESADEEELDEELAKGLMPDLDLLLVLPDDEVEPEEDWEIDPRLYLAFMWPGGLLDFGPTGEVLRSDERALSGQTVEHLEGSGRARLEEVRDEGGVRLAVIHVELEITTGSEHTVPATDEDGVERPEISVEVEIERTLEGTILWDLEGGHAVGAELRCEASTLTSESWSMVRGEDVEDEAEVERARLVKGTILYKALIERVE